MYFNIFRTIYIYCIGVAVIEVLCVWSGLMLYTKYSDCDPATNQQIDKREQMFPFFVLEVAGHIPGLSGFFISGIVSAGFRCKKFPNLHKSLNVFFVACYLPI